jgi:hypothetical protein
MEIQVGLIGQRAPDGFTDHDLVIHQQHDGVVLLLEYGAAILA